MAGLSIVHSLYRLLIGLLHAVLPPRPISSNRDPLVNDLIREILKFLPVKSLMRFKCVSRDWLSIITDPSFTAAYTSGLQGPIMIQAARVGSTHAIHDDWKNTLITYMNIDDTGPTATIEAYRHSNVDHGAEWKELHTAVINGLVCFFKYNSNKPWLYNIATRERVQLPLSRPVPTATGEARYYCSYHFGFDPVNKLYKLLKVSVILDVLRCRIDYSNLKPIMCEILTIGVDSSWRIIDSLPPKDLTHIQGIYSAGVIYWRKLEPECSLIAFHLANERFQLVPLPRQREWYSRFFLSRFAPGPGPVLFSHGNHPNTAQIYLYSHGDGGRESEGTWDSVIIPLPVVPNKYLFPESILPSGKVLITDCYSDFPFHEITPCRFLYDPVRKELEKLVITKWKVSRIELGSIEEPRGNYYLEENIVSLKRLVFS